MNELVEGNISFILNISEFIKEYADLEKEYSRKVETLVKKYTKKEKESKRCTVISGRTVKWTGREETSLGLGFNSFMLQFLNVSKSKLEMATLLGSKINENLKATASKKDEFRKKVGFHKYLII